MTWFLLVAGPRALKLYYPNQLCSLFKVYNMLNKKFKSDFLSEDIWFCYSLNN